MRQHWELALNSQSALTQASWVGVRVMVGYRALDDGADPWFLALLASTFAVPALLAAIPAGKLTDRIGGSVVALAGLVTAAAGIALMIAVPGLTVLLVASAIIGLGNLLAMVGQQTFVAHASEGGQSDGHFGSLSAAASVGQMIGPPVVTLISSAGQHDGPDTSIGLGVCLAFCILASPVYGLLRLKDHALQDRRPARDARNTDDDAKLITPGLWRSMAVSGAVLVTLDLLYTFLPVWAEEAGITATAVGVLLALRAGVSLLSRIGLTWLVSRFGRKTLLVASIAPACLALLFLPFVGLPGAVLAMIGLGLGLGVPQPLTMAWAISQTHPSLHGAVLGLRLSANRLAQITLPLAVGATAAPLGVAGIFWANSALLAGSLLIVWSSKNPNTEGTGD